MRIEAILAFCVQFSAYAESGPARLFFASCSACASVIESAARATSGSPVRLYRATPAGYHHTSPERSVEAV
jgi:hypothetical protein